MFLAWRFAGRCPYRFFNNLDSEYRPVGETDSCASCAGRGRLIHAGLPDAVCGECMGAGVVRAAPRPPLHPERTHAFEVACAIYAGQVASKSGGWGG